ncbi:VSP [Giardia duodenalis ATCC 50581]|uniref:VSP n=1 Tax=Giardia intestinalis (strain ATCC 50581 / GS clone H7) TaxID=598745 RepID=C6LT09_GIAIB|nr:VSP [Giardia intestinalis ATCC 50581]
MERRQTTLGLPASMPPLPPPVRIEGCKTCSADKKTCEECAENKYLTPTNQCISNCATIPGYYGTAENGKRVCKKCGVANCVVCGATGACDLCTDGFYGPSCSKCHESCRTCSGGAGADKCTSCMPGSALTYGSAGNTGTCGEGCVQSSESGAGKCETCGLTVEGTKYCSKCKIGTEYPQNGVCATKPTGRATASCKDSNIANGVCATCADGFFKMSGGCYSTGQLPGATVCAQTQAGGTCKTSADGYKLDADTLTTCPSNCKVCSSDTACTTCADGYAKLTSATTCTKCDAGCATCAGIASTCSTCADGYYLSNSKCIACDKSDGSITGVSGCLSCAAPSTGTGPVTCYVTQTPAVDPTDPSTNKSGLSSGAIAGISITVTTIIGRPVDKMSTYIIHTSVSAIVRPIQSPYPSPKTSVADKHSRMPTPATGGSSVPAFTAKDICKRIDSVLGRGSLGTVYSIKGHPGLAVKEIPIDEQDEGSVNTIRSELATLPALSHPGLLKCHQVVEDGSFIYIIVNRYSRTLDGLLIEHKRARTLISGETVFSILRQLADALAHLHGALVGNASGTTACRTAHRDLKPTSILLSGDGECIAIAHLGRCKDALWPEGAMDGPKPYMAPEVLLEGRTISASDIWSLGVIIYELATLKRLDFLEGKEPKDVFINGWRPDLSAVEDDSIKSILERIFVLAPVKRPTARDLCELLRVSDASVVRMRLRAMMLEEALNEANARIASLEKELQTKIDDLERRFTGVFETLPKHDMQASAHHTSASAPLSAAVSPALPALEKSVSCTPLVHAAIAGDAKAAEGRLSGDDQMNDSGDAVSVPATGTSGGDGAEPLNPAGDHAATALMSAAERGDVEAVRALMPLQKEWRANLFGSGKTALMMAAMCGQAEVVGYWWSTRAVDRIRAIRLLLCTQYMITT